VDRNSNPFARNRNLCLLFDVVAKRYGCRPSEIRNGTFEDFQFDWICSENGIAMEENEMKKAQKKRR
jgi:hypothetical protein